MVGFRCYDRDLSMPYVETGDELIPLLMLLSLAFAGPAASVSPSHNFQHKAVRRVIFAKLRGKGKSASGDGKQSHSLMLPLLCFTINYVFSVIFMLHDLVPIVLYKYVSCPQKQHFFSLHVHEM